MYSPFNIKTVYLVLGHDCNFSCKYCIQNEEFRACTAKKTQAISDKVFEYLEEIDSFKLDSDKKIRIIFWGGEPLLYFDTIKDVVLKTNDKFQYGTISNGALLSQEIVDFFNEHEMFFTVSSDGPNTVQTRKVNILENKNFCHLFKQIKHRGVSSVISAYNQDFQALVRYITDKTGDININFDLLMPSESLPQDAFDFNWNNLMDSLIVMANKAAEDILLGEETNESKFFVKIMNRINNGTKDPNRFINRYCEELHSAVSIDINGNILLCHNSSEKMGDTQTDPIEIECSHIKKLEEINITKLKDCKSCFIEQYCRGDCKLTRESYRGIKESCELRRSVFSATFYLIDKLNNYFEEVDLSEDL